MPCYLRGSPGQNKAWLSERRPTVGRRHSTEPCRVDMALGPDLPEGHREDPELRSVPQSQATSCSLAGCAQGHSAPGTGGSHGICHGLQNANQELQRSPILFLPGVGASLDRAHSPRRSQRRGEGGRLRCHVNFPPETVPTLSQTRGIDVKRKTVNLYRTACQAFLFLKENILDIGIWFDEKKKKKAGRWQTR